jgi:hypothetical protein
MCDLWNAATWRKSKKFDHATLEHLFRSSRCCPEDLFCSRPPCFSVCRATIMMSTTVADISISRSYVTSDQALCYINLSLASKASYQLHSHFDTQYDYVTDYLNSVETNNRNSKAISAISTNLSAGFIPKHRLAEAWTRFCRKSFR